jgi:hypothetical protein
VGRKQSFGVLKQVVHIHPVGLKKLKAYCIRLAKCYEFEWKEDKKKKETQIN